MGAGASAPGAMERLSDPVDEATAMNFLGMCFDRADCKCYQLNSQFLFKIVLPLSVLSCQLFFLSEPFYANLFVQGETITGGTGSVAKDTFITTITVRNHTPSLRAWLEFWRIDELTEILEEL